MLGLGTGAALVKPDLLFGVGGDAAELAVPSTGLAKSWVVYPGRSLGCNAGALSVFAQEHVVSPQFLPGVDPHEIFYKAALELQQRLGQVMIDRLLEVPEPLRRNVEVVTSIFMPIHARTKHCWATSEESKGLRDEDFKGFDVVADCAIEVKGYGVRGREERGRPYGAGWEPSADTKVFSKTGEYPMEMLGNLDLGHLMSIDAKMYAGDARMATKLGNILLATT